MSEENPFEDPPEIDDMEVEEVGLVCWRESGRVCGPDCPAFEEKSIEEPLWNCCILINLRRAQAKSFANIAAELKRLNDNSETLVSPDEQESLEARRRAKDLKEALDERDQKPPTPTY
jgi:hypothetical protein